MMPQELENSLSCHSGDKPRALAFRALGPAFLILNVTIAFSAAAFRANCFKFRYLDVLSTHGFRFNTIHRSTAAMHLWPHLNAESTTE